MQKLFDEKLSKLWQRLKCPNRNIRFTYLDTDVQNQTFCSHYYKSSSFEPSSSAIRFNTKTGSIANIQPDSVPRLQKVINPIYIALQTHVEPCAWPNSAHGLIEISNSNSKSTLWSTGTMIGLNLVLTTASNLYSCSNPCSFKFHPAIDKQFYSSAGGVDIFKVYFSENETQDYALLVLDYPIGLRTGYFGLYIQRGIDDKLLHKGQEVTSSVFQSIEDAQGGRRKSFKLKTKTTTIKEIYEDKTDKYVIRLEKSFNQSSDVDCGSIFLKDGQTYYIVGLQENRVKKDKDEEAKAKIMSPFGRDDIDLIRRWVEYSNRSILSIFNEEIQNEESPFMEGNTDTAKISESKVATRDPWIYLLALELSRIAINSTEIECLVNSYTWIYLHTLNLSKNNIGDDGAASLRKNHSWVHLCNLNLSESNITKQGASELAKNSSWTNLHTLRLTKNSIGDEGAVSLGKNYSWVRLINLDLKRNSIACTGIAGLAKNYSWTRLETLNLKLNKIGVKGAACLANNHSWLHLRTLNLSWNVIGDSGAIKLAKNSSWVHLHTLNLSKCSMGGKGVIALGKNRSWIQLENLTLSCNDIGDKGAAGLAKNSSWIRLRTLNLLQSDVKSKGATAGLGRNSSWVHLHTLNLGYNNISDEGAARLGKNRSWVNLYTLNLERNSIRDRGAAGLGRNDSWIYLNNMILNHNRIGDEGAIGLGGNGSWVSLNTLDLFDNCIGDEGATGLAKNTSWTGLRILKVYSNYIKIEGYENLRNNNSWTNLEKVI